MRIFGVLLNRIVMGFVERLDANAIRFIIASMDLKY